MGSVLVSSSVLYFLVVKNCNGSENMSQKKSIFQERRLLFGAWYSAWPPAVFHFDALKWNCPSCFEITSGHSRRQKKAHSLPDNRSLWVGFSTLTLDLGNTFLLFHLKHAKWARVGTSPRIWLVSLLLGQHVNVRLNIHIFCYST